MVLNDTLAATLSKLDNAGRAQKDGPVRVLHTKLTHAVLDILKEQGYVSEFAELVEGRKAFVDVTLAGTINKVGVIKPRFSFKITEARNFEKQFLPAKDFGVIIVSTPKGIMTLENAKKENTGGKLIAYCY